MQLKVLLVEDSPADEELTLLALRRTSGPPLELRTAGTLAAALKLLGQETFDVVLCDLNLPDSQGLETVRALVAVGPPVVAHTGTVDESVGPAAVATGADDFVAKGSVAGSRLRSILQFAVERRRRAPVQQTPTERLEQLVAERTASLQDATSLLRTVTNNVDAGILLGQLDPFRILFVNPAFEHLFNLSAAKLLANNMAWVEAILPDDLDAVLAKFAQAQTGPTTSRFRVASPDGPRWIAASTRISQERSDGPRYMNVVTTDVTAEVEAERLRGVAVQREAELASERDANKFKSDFLNLAAHELANPISPIRLEVASLRAMNTALYHDGRISDLADAMDANLRRLGGLLQDMRQVGRLQTKTLTFNLEETDLAKLCSAAVASLRGLAEQAGLDLAYVAPPPTMAHVDANRCAEVLLNLGSNAIKYTPAGGRVVVKLVPQGNEARISVSDTGRGIAAEDIPRLFTPFVRVGDEKAAPGTGLGLYICKGLVEAQGGTIALSSAGLGKGTTVLVGLPLAAPAAAEA